MLSYKVTVRNPSGLHLRPAGLLCGEAIKYKSSITFQYAGGTANAKSVLSVLGACVKAGMRSHWSARVRMNRLR